MRTAHWTVRLPKQQWRRGASAKFLQFIVPALFCDTVDRALHEINLTKQILMRSCTFLFLNYLQACPPSLRSFHQSHFIVRHTLLYVSKDIELLPYSKMYYYRTCARMYVQVDKTLLLNSKNTVKRFPHGNTFPVLRWYHCTHNCTITRANVHNNIGPSTNDRRPNQPQSRDADIHNLYMKYPAATYHHTAHGRILAVSRPISALSDFH